MSVDAVGLLVPVVVLGGAVVGFVFLVRWTLTQRRALRDRRAAGRAPEEAPSHRALRITLGAVLLVAAAFSWYFFVR